MDHAVKKNTGHNFLWNSTHMKRVPFTMTFPITKEVVFILGVMNNVINILTKKEMTRLPYMYMYISME